MVCWSRRLRARLSGFERRLDRRLPGRGEQPNEDGFVLLESIVAIGLISIIMAAMATFFVNAVASTAQQRSRQIATTIGSSALETVRGLPASDLTTGHNTVPTLALTQTVNNVVYTVATDFASCWIPTDGSSTVCGLTAQTTGIKYLRAVVSVSWTQNRCPSAGCTYVTSTLLSAAPDPIFNLNQTPPAVPAIVSPGNQTAAVGDTVNLQLAVAGNTGVAPLTWADSNNTLPPGIAIDPASGLISGSPTTVVTAKAVTITVTDAFLRTATVSFTWTVYPRLTIAAVAAQTATRGTAVTTLTLTATGGSGTPYTWSDPNSTLPPGLVVSTVSNQGRVTGTPTAGGTYAVQLAVKDSSNSRTATVNFVWTVVYPPLSTGNPGAQITTVNTVASPVQLTAGGGSGNYVWSGGATLPTGLTLSSSGLITGTPTTVGTSSVSLQLADPVADPTGRGTLTVAFQWAVVNRPTIVAPANQVTTVGAAVSFTLPTTCPNTPCTYALRNGPATLTVSSAGVVSGTITSSAQTFSAVTVVVTDSDGATATTASFTWRVNAAPTVTSPGNQTVYKGTADTLDVSALVDGGTAPFIYTATGLPSWLTINRTTGSVSGTAPNAKSTTTGITVKVTDSSGVSDTSASFKWFVTDLATSIEDQTTSRSTTVRLDLDTFTTGGTRPYTYTISGKPSWLTLTGSTGVLSGTSPNANSLTTGITITVTDSTGASITSAPFRWIVTDLRWSTIPTQIDFRNSSASLDASNYNSGGTGALTYTASGLPAGLTINGTTGLISGTPSVTRSTSYSPTVTVTDSVGASVTSSSFTWYIL